MRAFHFSRAHRQRRDRPARRSALFNEVRRADNIGNRIPGADFVEGDVLRIDAMHRALGNGKAGEDILRPLLMRLCAQYLVTEKRPGAVTPLDPVAHFHLSNGARMERLNWMADTSETGLQRAGGMMINYLYKLSNIDANHEAYTGSGKVVASSSIKGIAKGK